MAQDRGTPWDPSGASLNHAQGCLHQPFGAGLFPTSRITGLSFSKYADDMAISEVHGFAGRAGTRLLARKAETWAEHVRITLDFGAFL